MDALLDILRATRLSGGIVLEAEFTAPWCVSSQIGPEDCTPFTPEPANIIAYHYISAGRGRAAGGLAQAVISTRTTR